MSSRKDVMEGRCSSSEQREVAAQCKWRGEAGLRSAHVWVDNGGVGVVDDGRNEHSQDS